MGASHTPLRILQMLARFAVDGYTQGRLSVDGLAERITGLPPEESAFVALEAASLLPSSVERKLRLALVRLAAARRAGKQPEDSCAPLSSGDILTLGASGQPIPVDRALATFALASNWMQIYDGRTSPGTAYRALACEWAFVGPVRPPYELASTALARRFAK